MNTRVPFDSHYVQLVGTAVYLFSYYEWSIIYIIERLNPGFVSEYCREKKITSGGVCKQLKKELDKDAGSHDVDRLALCSCHDDFKSLIDKRNALIHAHPITDITGEQILNYQSRPQAVIPDKKWDESEIESFIQDVDSAAVRAGALLYQFKP